MSPSFLRLLKYSVIRIKPLIDQYFEIMLQFYEIKSNVNRSLDKT